MTIYESIFWERYEKLHLEKKGWLKVSYIAEGPYSCDAIRYRLFAKFPTKMAFKTLMAALRNSCKATEVQIWDFVEGPIGKCLLTIDTKTGLILINQRH